MKLFFYGLVFALAGVRADEPVAASRVTGGSVAPAGRFDYHAAVLNSPTGTLRCSGTLVSSRVVLGAGHCSAGNYIMLSCTDLEDRGNCEIIETVESKVHPEYESFPAPMRDFRIHVLKSDAATEPIGYVAAASWWRIYDNTKLRVIGWGRTSHNGPMSSKLLQANVRTYNQRSCKNYYRSQGISIKSFHMCTRETGKGPCQGDSGGPLMVQCDGNKKDVLVGTVSFGDVCGSTPAVYGRFSAESDWIREQVSNYGGSLATPPPYKDPCGEAPAPTLPTSYPTPYPTRPPIGICWFFC